MFLCLEGCIAEQRQDHCQLNQSLSHIAFQLDVSYRRRKGMMKP